MKLMVAVQSLAPLLWWPDVFLAACLRQAHLLVTVGIIAFLCVAGALITIVTTDAFHLMRVLQILRRQWIAAGAAENMLAYFQPMPH